ncbi:MAG: DNA primase [Oscillospiraceae bacterium]|nr:DNA primase [Oscillospiraceae bacterium]
MPRFSDEFLERVKDANRIEDVARQYVSLKRSGRLYKCNCPFHSEKTPSCVIYPDNGSFYCFGCGAGGSVITFISKIENLDFAESVKFLADRAGIAVPENGFEDPRAESKKRILQMNKDAAKFFYANLKTPDGKAGLEYLIQKRRLRPETIKSFGLGVAVNRWTSLTNHMLSLGYTEEELLAGSLISKKNGRCFDFFVNRVMFPIFDLRGNVVAFSGRTLDPNPQGMKYLNSRGTPVYEKSRTLFAMNFAKNSAAKSKRLILCEGNLDVITLHQAGFTEAVATCGTAITSEHARLMAQYCDEVYICYDADAAGQKATSAAIGLLSAAGLKSKVVRISGDGVKDVDDYINKLGADRFRLLLNGSEGSIEFELAKCKQDLDVETDMGKVEYLKRTVAVLAGIESPVQRDVYISKVALENSVTKDYLSEEVKAYLRNRNREAKKQDDRELVRTVSGSRTANPNRTLTKREKAEAGVIAYALNHHEKQGEIFGSLESERFSDEFFRKAYETLRNCYENGGYATITTLENEFYGEDMDKISHILNQSREIMIDENTLADYIRILNSDSETPEDASKMSDDDLLAYTSKLRREKN